MHVLELGSSHLLSNSIFKHNQVFFCYVYQEYGVNYAGDLFGISCKILFNMVSLIYLLVVSTCNMVHYKKALVIKVICYNNVNILFRLDRSVS